MMITEHVALTRKNCGSCNTSTYSPGTSNVTAVQAEGPADRQVNPSLAIEDIRTAS